MTCFIVYLNSDTLSAVFKKEIGIAVVLINVGEVVLRIKKRRLFSTESVRKSSMNRFSGALPLGVTSCSIIAVLHILKVYLVSETSSLFGLIPADSFKIRYRPASCFGNSVHNFQHICKLL